ncbi:hypothetical protein P153DRAFT_400795 [Dothidotthia symphoricarpi CBS 119687]|uniref:BTB domain-containing protein n=1 Tax=Dothidotthia symphoricarpi CBS 119687 TaxID=1392245 RepID=A0A6A6A166_9PLEO|nr:uncharacterized protein P153DRAFT_400795 [Dothidotthia symphoricarpi CBS 119687]KAF2124707.1 hypothetical protein P153DRAFT_400795 [Dothidotthia symphoricarpi CBS 119687]
MAGSENLNKRGSNSMSNSPAQKKTRHLFNSGLLIDSTPITVFVGHTESRFSVHECLLTTDSEFFKSALSKEWKENLERIVKLPEAKPEAFHLYAKWLYSGKVYSGKVYSSKNNDTYEKNNIEYNNEWSRLVDCYKLGDFLLSLDFKDATIDAISEVSISRDILRVDFASYIYPISTKESLHRTLCRDLTIHLWDRKFANIRDPSLPREFLEDLLVDIGPQLSNGLKDQGLHVFAHCLNTCNYHEHTRFDKPCYKTKFSY